MSEEQDLSPVGDCDGGIHKKIYLPIAKKGEKRKVVRHACLF